MAEDHTDDIRNIAEGDEVQITTSEGHLLDMTCVEITKDHAANPEIIRETTKWWFDMGDEEVLMVRVEGLRESADMEPFPHDKAIWNIQREMGYGYAEELKILGPDVQAQ